MKHRKRVQKLIIASVLCAIILSVSTYAWFIGMKTVNVSPFEIKIATTESLALSLDGVNFKEELDITKDKLKATGVGTGEAYVGNTNSWDDKGLIPVSTIGKIDSSTSRLIMFEKGSLTASKGGYRLLSSRVTNSGDGEATGYVAFDLFIRNLSGNAYYKGLDIENEEGIYLTPDSKAVIAKDGGKPNSGIENSVRVAFAQIGRVVATEKNGDKIGGIKCQGSPADVTGICGRDATIWEPNDKAHEQNAINWYTTSCKARTALGYQEGACGEVTNGAYAPTYAIAKEIGEAQDPTVDVYDGAEYNSDTRSTVSGHLVKQTTFTDTDKDKAGIERPEFMYLAPNSITKIRVYVFIEGQDIDNYDFASLGQKVSINFGFTKERFYGEDIEYNSPSTTNNGPDLPPTVSARPVK